MWECPVLDERFVGEKHFQLQNGVSGQRSGEEGSECLHRAWNSSVDTCLDQEGSCFDSQVGDIKLPINSAKQWAQDWHKTRRKPESTYIHCFGGLWSF